MRVYWCRFNPAGRRSAIRGPGSDRCGSAPSPSTLDSGKACLISNRCPAQTLYPQRIVLSDMINQPRQSGAHVPMQGD
jgi:hypothetical protein